MIDLLRWTIALPVGIAAAIVFTLGIGIAFGSAHGFDRVAAFWDAVDMNGMPIIGTHMLVVTRFISAATLVGITVFTVPYYHKQVAIIIAFLVSVAAIGLLNVVSLGIIDTHLAIGFGGWYRNIVEMLSIVTGSIVGAIGGCQKRWNRVPT